ncbi:MAG: cation diffusion facilitator family transporter [Actinomycetota bacterium]
MGLVLVITLVVVGAQWVGVAITGSLSLAADAGHQLTDAVGIAIALLAARIAARPPSPTRTFGYLRAEVLSATIHATLISVMCVLLVWESIRRWNAPAEVSGSGVVLFAFIGLSANLCGVLILKAHSKSNLNIRTAFLDVAADAATSAVVLVTGAVMSITDISRLDIVATAIVVIAIVARTWGVIGEAIHILMEGAPANVHPSEVRQDILSTEGVIDVHDLHVWSTSSDSPMISAHVVVSETLHNEGRAGWILDELEHRMEEHFGVHHTTFQIEHPEHQNHEHFHHE